MAQTADRDTNRALRARFDEVYGQYQQLRSGLDELQQRLADVRATERSADGRVTATVGPRGQLLRLDLDPGIYRDRDAEALAAAITETVQRAAASVTASVQHLVGGYLPAGSGALDFVRDGDFGALLRRGDAQLRAEADRDG